MFCENNDGKINKLCYEYFTPGAVTNINKGNIYGKENIDSR